MSKCGLSQDCKALSTLKNQSQLTTSLKKENRYRSLLTDDKQGFNKIQHSFIIKTL